MRAKGGLGAVQALEAQTKKERKIGPIWHVRDLARAEGRRLEADEGGERGR